MIILEAASLQNALTLQPMIVNGASLSDRRSAVLPCPRRAPGGHDRGGGCCRAGDRPDLGAAAAGGDPAGARSVGLAGPGAMPAGALHAWRMAAAAINNFVSFDVQAVALIVLAWAGGMDIESVLWTVAATSLLGVLVGFWRFEGTSAASETTSARRRARRSALAARSPARIRSQRRRWAPTRR